jgi:hypothetical protein
VWCVDVLRGIALLAILIANVSDFGLPGWGYLVPLGTSKPASLVRTLTDHGNEVNPSPGRLFLRYQRRCYHCAVDTQLGQLPVQYESCWPRFVAGAQLLRRTKLPDELADRIFAVGNRPQAAYLPIRFRYGNCDRLSMDIHAQKS